MRVRLLIPLAVLAIVATGVGVAVAAMGPEGAQAHALASVSSQAQVETPAGKPKSGLDPARQDQTGPRRGRARAQRRHRPRAGASPRAA